LLQRTNEHAAGIQGVLQHRISGVAVTTNTIQPSFRRRMVLEFVSSDPKTFGIGVNPKKIRPK
jgi:hypothetical protein